MIRHRVTRAPLPCPICYERHDPTVAHGERVQFDGEVLTEDELRLRGVIA